MGVRFRRGEKGAAILPSCACSLRRQRGAIPTFPVAGEGGATTRGGVDDTGEAQEKTPWGQVSVGVEVGVSKGGLPREFGRLLPWAARQCRVAPSRFPGGKR